MSRQEKLNPFQRLAVRWMTNYSLKSEGYAPAFFEELVRTMGVFRFMKWGQVLQKVTGELEELHGPDVAQALIGLAALWNGCEYCSRGHMLAANLYRLKATGSPLPIDERELSGLMRQKDDEVLGRLSTLLSAPADAELRRLVLRQSELKRGVPATASREDQVLLACIAAWDWVNECSIVAHDADVPPLARIAKERELLVRYRELRPLEARPAETAATTPVLAGA